MKKKNKPETKDFDQRFDEGKATLDFSSGVVTTGLSQTIKLPPMDIPAWLAMEIEHLAQFQANSKASVIRQLLVEALETRRQRLVS